MEEIISRKNTKAKNSTKCACPGCIKNGKDSFKKSLGYYHKGVYYRSKTHARKAVKTKVD